MIVISHRGNLNGANPERENHPDYIVEAIEKGFDVEVDVWFRDDKIWLGHDEPQYEIPYDFLTEHRNELWIHCKSIATLVKLSRDIQLNFFLHEDAIAITSLGYLFTAPGYPLECNSVAVMPELAKDWNIGKARFVCTDYPYKYK